MFKHILIPCDGSELSQKAALQAIGFAKEIGAKITAVTVTAPWHSVAIGELAVVMPEKEYDARAETNAWATLNVITDAAKAAGVPRNAIHLHNASAYEAIIEAAKANGCDLIAMGSHGRRGLSGFLLGSETVRVLTHSTIPVLVLKG